jgi:hypothetical protein
MILLILEAGISLYEINLLGSRNVSTHDACWVCVFMLKYDHSL